jgi:hypothetical protein
LVVLVASVEPAGLAAQAVQAVREEQVEPAGLAEQAVTLAADLDRRADRLVEAQLLAEALVIDT